MAINYFDIPIKKRDLTISLPKEKIASWADNKFVTAYFNALSSMFPVGERFFIVSVKAFKGAIMNERLKIQIDGFIRQEASHAGFHDQYNKLLVKRGYKISRMISKVEIAINFLYRVLNPKQWLVITVAYEHLTACLGDHFHRKIPTIYWDTNYLTLWRLHMIEEIEHKSVVFDVYSEIKGNYCARVFTLFVVIIVFTGMLTHRLVHVLLKEKLLWKMQTWVIGSKFVFGRNGIFWSVVACALQYMKIGFHPWNKNNYFVVREFDNELGL